MNNTSEINTTVAKNHIGLSNEFTPLLNEKLNDLLANYEVFYQNVRGFHWNIQGDKFFELHVKFEELYNDLHEKIDEIAERILTLGGEPLHAFSDYVEHSAVSEVKKEYDAESTVSSILAAFRILLIKQRELLDLSDEASDEGTNALMSDYIREQEKLVWMYSAYLK